MNSEPALAADDIPRPDVSRLVTEDDTPVDNPFCEKQMRLLTGPLYDSWKPGFPFVAMANVGLYFSLNSPVLVPDTLVSVGVELPADLHPKEHRAYFFWLYGKSPDVVVEIVSNKEGGELDRKLRGYAFHGVPYYVVFDPDGFIQETALRTFQLDHSGSEPRYRALDRPVFPSAHLGLVEWDGEFEGRRARWLRWIDDAGALIPLGVERAGQEMARADREKARADALAAKLRELGVDPAPV